MFDLYRAAFWQRAKARPRINRVPQGRPSHFGRPLRRWEMWRRWRERSTGNPDSLLLLSGVSVFSPLPDPKVFSPDDPV
jgi:hypothetical protein